MVQHKAMTVTWKTWRNVVHEVAKNYMKDLEKSHADSAAQSRESYENDLEKSRDDSAARRREHRRRNRGLGSQWPQFCYYVLRSLQLSKADI